MLTAKALSLIHQKFDKDYKEEKKAEAEGGVLKALNAVLPPQAAALKAVLAVLSSLPKPVQAVLALGAVAVTLGVSYSIYRVVKKITDWFGMALPRFEDVPYIGAFASLFGAPSKVLDADEDNLARLLSSESVNLPDEAYGLIPSGLPTLRQHPPSKVKPTQDYAPIVGNAAPSGMIPLSTIGVSGNMRQASPAVAQALEFASKTFGIPLEEVYATALQESGLGTNMAAPTSSARGLFQFIAGTWNQMRKEYPEYAKAYNIGPANGTSMNDDRMDLVKSAVMYGLFRNANIASLKGLTSGNQTVDSYLAHFLGAGGAKRMLAALRSSPDAPVTSAVGHAQYAANKSLMQVSKTDSRIISVRDFVTRIYNKIGVTAAKYAQNFTTPGKTPATSVAALAPPTKVAAQQATTSVVKATPPQTSRVSQKKAKKETEVASASPDLLQSIPTTPSTPKSGPSASYAPVRLANGTTALAPL